MRLFFEDGAKSNFSEPPPATKPKPSREAYVGLLTNLEKAPAGREKADCLLSLYRRMLKDHVNFSDILTPQDETVHAGIKDSRTATDLGYDAATNTYWCPSLENEDLKKSWDPHSKMPTVTKAPNRDAANLVWMTELRAISTWATSASVSHALAIKEAAPH